MVANPMKKRNSTRWADDAGWATSSPPSASRNAAKRKEPERRPQDQRGGDHPERGRLVDDEVLEARALTARSSRSNVDQEERGERHELPEHEEEDEVGGDNDPYDPGEEDLQHRVVLGDAVAAVVRHVLDRVERREHGDGAGDDEEERAEGIDVHGQAGGQRRQGEQPPLRPPFRRRRSSPRHRRVARRQPRRRRRSPNRRAPAPRAGEADERSADEQQHAVQEQESGGHDVTFRSAARGGCQRPGRAGTRSSGRPTRRSSPTAGRC